MHHRLSLILFSLTLISFGACDLVDPLGSQPSLNNSIDSVKVSSIKFDIRHLMSSEEWVYFPGENVDITNFKNIDSVRFAANLRCRGFYDLCIVELYDFTNMQAIPSSTVDSNTRFYFKYVESPNIYFEFPKDEVLLGIRMRSSKEGNYVEVAYDSEILIYSH